MAKFLVEQAELDRTDTIKGYYSLHDVTMDDDQPLTISFNDTDITHVKYFKPQPHHHPKQTKTKWTYKLLLLMRKASMESMKATLVEL